MLCLTRLPTVIRQESLLRARLCSSTSVTLIGEASSPGFYKGRVCIINDPLEQEEKPKEGDVIVGKVTNSSWNSMISSAGAVVIEMGGKVSHGPMVARRVGIPCVSNFPSSLWDYVEDGDEVIVRGSVGTLEILGKSPIPGKPLELPKEDESGVEMTMTPEEIEEKFKQLSGQIPRE
eukprot:TRINITY_DN13813_c0_g1_i1.p1 TRINITY_DN13813_c0_g1~~TRINITY_DN13813_c0_g1_i1.p1  ORF type:complete len:177 (-),score=33.84 TRINITY_DN13813_c0_g1_i1:31-561(-)